MHKEGFTRIDAELKASQATVQLARYTVTHPCECDMTQASGFRLTYFSQRPPNATARIADHRTSPAFQRLGDLFMLPEHQRIVARGDIGDGYAVTVQLDSEILREWIGEKSGWTERELSACLNIQSTPLRELMSRFADEAATPGFACNAMVDSLAVQASIEFMRHHGGINAAPTRGGLQQWRMRVIDERLAECTAPPTLTELAALCNLSSRQLARSFRAACGASVGDYIAQKRVELAKRLLKTDKGIKAIAHDMGFKSSSGFCYSFRRSTGQSPGEFRAEARRRSVSARHDTSRSANSH